MDNTPFRLLCSTFKYLFRNIANVTTLKIYILNLTVILSKGFHSLMLSLGTLAKLEKEKEKAVYCSGLELRVD